MKVAIRVPNQVAGTQTGAVREQAVPLCWHVITCEYPPQAGGVSDYTGEVAAGLAGQGDEVHVWCPAWSGCQPQVEGVAVHRELGAIAPSDLSHVGQQLDRFSTPRRILVQWVPHGYGYRSMNLAFCFWLWNRAAWHGDKVEIMLHEPYLPFRAGSWRQNAAALVHRLMTIVMLRAPERVWISIPEWEHRLRPYALGRKVPFQWLPIPSNIPLTDNPGAIQAARRRYAPSGGLLIGHFGTFGWPITSVLEPILLALADDPAKQTILLMGIGSQEFLEALVRKEARFAGLIQATGALAAADLSCHVSACDLLIQPYPDGVSSRRTSFMVGLSHGKPVITTAGHLTEPLWAASDGVRLAPVGDVEVFVSLVRQVRDDAHGRTLLGTAAQKLYRDRFDPQHVISSLRSAAADR